MNLFHLFIIIFGLLLFIVALILGYILGKISSNTGVIDTKTKKNNSTKNGSVPEIIDDTKFVIKVKTEGLQKKYEKLGDVKSSDHNINNAISKLKNMKG